MASIGGGERSPRWLIRAALTSICATWQSQPEREAPDANLCEAVCGRTCGPARLLELELFAVGHTASFRRLGSRFAESSRDADVRLSSVRFFHRDRAYSPH